ncbi:hypothetical protein ACTWQL_13770 [Pseudalkalibacillus sp. R45]|uniref:hypothetical protein n=1 Tax=Pseudalkalibacillus sp. R45 TaxID=3457433 RepID=UPI003FCEE1D4
MSLEKIKSSLEKAHQIKNTSAKFLRELQNPVRSEIAKASTDRDLSEEGRKKKADEIREQAGIEIMERLHLRKQQYTAELVKAQKAADRIVHAPKPKPDAETLRRFEKSFGSFKTELMLTPRADVAQDKLNDFIATIKDPYIADKVAAEFSDLASNILGGTTGDGTAKAKLGLAKSFEELRNKSESDEIKEARALLESADSSLADPKFYRAELYREAAREIMPVEYVDYLDDTDAFYREYDGLKPADYVDEELEKEKEIEKHNRPFDEGNDRLHALSKSIDKLHNQLKQ